MDVAEVLDFVRANHHAILATMRSDDGVQMSPIAATVDAENKIVISTREPSIKVQNLRRSPFAWLFLFEDKFFGGWHQAEGPIEIVSLPDAMNGLIEYYRSISGEHPDWDEYRSAMTEQRRVLLRMTVKRVGPTKAG
jgi:PPOX class probable F420-dependent enzyme